MPLHLQTHIMEPKLRVIINLQHHDHKQSEPFLCHNLYHEYSCHLTPILVNIQQTMANHYFFLWVYKSTISMARGPYPNATTDIRHLEGSEAKCLHEDLPGDQAEKITARAKGRWV